MAKFFEDFTELLRSLEVGSFLKAVLILLAGFFLARLIKRWLKLKRFDLHQATIIRRMLSATVLVVSFLWALHEIGVEFGILLGAAGIFTVAIGFASQTSASNIISGIFLVAEHSFQIGDIIRVAGTTGEVLSIDLLSVKIRTFDNLLVRIPNETMLKSEVTNLTKFPIRRLDMKIGVAYKEDLANVRQVLLDVAAKNPLCLTEPNPLFIFLAFGSSALELQFSVWAKRENYIELRNTMHEEVKLAFDENGIEIPFPHLSLYSGSVTKPLPVQLLNGQDDTPNNEDVEQAG